MSSVYMTVEDKLKDNSPYMIKEFDKMTRNERDNMNLMIKVDLFIK